jgi:methyl-accepting chemotaxis protein
MKNMKIGKKLIVGFGVPIALMVAIVALVMTLNLITISNVQAVAVQTDLWDYAGNARTEFMNARVQSNQLIYGYQESLYTAAMSYVETADAQLDTVLTYIDENPDVLGDFKDDATTASDELTSYKAVLVDMGNVLKLSDEEKALTATAGAALTTEMDAIFDGQMSSLNTDFDNYLNAVTATERTGIRSERMEKINGIYDLTSQLAEVRVAVKGNLESFDEAGADDAIAKIDGLIANTTAYKNTLNVQSNIQACEELIATLTDYKSNFSDYKQAQLDAAATLERFREDAASATDAINIIADQNTAVNAALEESENMATIALIAVTALVVIAIIASVIMASTIRKQIAGPVAVITDTLKAMSTRGRTNFTEEELAIQKKLASGKDEMAECAQYLSRLTSALNGVAELLTTVSNGDLTIEHTQMSEDDIISLSIIKMIDNLNSMFGEIDRASNQVSIGANQISDASQSLAEGSTEQAATVEELSASIQDVADKTRLNADRAVNASAMSAEVKNNAEKGAVQMSQMTEAVTEINQASQDISKVIKVIDDIAFQTNILALNAAVEAARAGEAGKGFAVVADEVRNLASKSAAAAKETGALIENSMKKAELGSTIASETAASLSEIVEGINKSTDLITEIANSSEEQAIAINQINDGIVQVSEVVQKNSATAEECAASAEELNAQSAILSDNVAQFKLKHA